jgi:hypothetical protein
VGDGCKQRVVTKVVKHRRNAPIRLWIAGRWQHGASHTVSTQHDLINSSQASKRLRTRTQRLVRPLELLAWLVVHSLGVDALVVVDVVLLEEAGLPEMLPAVVSVRGAASTLA